MRRFTFALGFKSERRVTRVGTWRRNTSSTWGFVLWLNFGEEVAKDPRSQFRDRPDVIETTSSRGADSPLRVGHDEGSGW